MIVILTETADELVHSLKSYFLIDEHYVILTVENEIDENLDSWIETFDGVVDDTEHIVFNVPFLVVTESKDILDSLYGSFKFDFFHEIEDIDEAMIVFVKNGFLPLDKQTITDYIKSTIPATLSNNDKILMLFQRLGYIDDKHTPTPKLIASLCSDEETAKYANVLMVVVSNPEIPTTDDRFKQFVLEALKYVDYNIFAALATEWQTKNNVWSTKQNRYIFIGYSST